MTDPLRVVVLDSDADSRELLQTALELDGLQPVPGDLLAFQLGDQNLVAFLDRTRPDAIVYDLGLPYHASWEYLQWARQQPAFARAGLVLTTTNAQMTERLFGVKAINKPYDLRVLVDLIRDAASRARYAGRHGRQAGIASSREPGAARRSHSPSR